MGEALTKHIAVAKNCKLATGCFAAETNQYYDGSYTGVNFICDDEGSYTFITADGMSFCVGTYKNGCDTPTWSTGRTGDMRQTCGSIRIDVNGLKPPNAYGRDTFYFLITNEKGAILYPKGGADDRWYAGGDSWWRNPPDGNIPRYCVPGNKWGAYCAGRILEEGWEMNY